MKSSEYFQRATIFQIQYKHELKEARSSLALIAEAGTRLLRKMADLKRHTIEWESNASAAVYTDPVRRIKVGNNRRAMGLRCGGGIV